MNWIETTVGEYCPFVYGKGLPKPQRAEGNIPVFGSNGCVDYHNKSYVNGPGIIIGRKGSVGAVHLSADPFWPIDTSFYVEKDSIDELKFTYYLLKSLGLEGMNSDSAVPGLNRENAHALPIRIPEKKQDREKLGKWISVYDSKIELNRQTNQTLEQIAKAMFKSWFVDFDPVRAKIAANVAGENAQRAAMAVISGKNQAELDLLQQQHLAQYQQLQAIAALFPDHLIDSELGEIPEGWEVGDLNKLAHLNVHSWTKKSEPEDIFYVDLANTKNGVIENTQYYCWSDAPSRAKRILMEGDTIVGTVRPGNRSFAFIGKDEKQLTGSTGFAVLSPKEFFYREYLYLVATSDESIDRLAHLADGGAYPAVRPDVVTSLTAIRASELIFKAFSRLVKPLFDKRQENLKSQLIYSDLRDSLLPKLLSGELSIDTSETEF